jgi:flagellar hook assembly protein FlgD/outer membrane protein OmpA-like peptidoglycan-associated protein
MKKPLALLSIACILSFGVYAESGFLDFSSAQLLAGGAGSASLDSPQGVLLNPAVSAGEQRVVLDLSWIPLLGLGAEQGWGNVFNIGVTIPTRAGVFSSSGRIASASFPSLSWGTLGALNLSFSKDLFPKLWIGVGLGAEFGGAAGATDWGLGLDLGFLNVIGDSGAFKDLRWGAAIRNMGKGYAYTTTPAPSVVLARPPVFTPALGAAFSLVRTDQLRLSFSPEISFPTFQDIRFGLGAEFAVADIFFLDMSGILDLRQIAGWEPARQLPITFGASLKLKNMKIKSRSFEVNEFKTTIAAAPLQAGIWAFGAGVNVPFGLRDATPPQITIDTAGEKYISPNLDGVKDDLVLDLAITDARFVKGFRFVVQNSVGTAVRTILNKEDRPENRDFKGIMARLAYVKKGITIPPTIRWDGKSDAGAMVPDGAYRYFVEAWDDNDNVGKSGIGTVVVDNTAPSVAVSAPYLIFSPNGDGNKDTLPLEQSGSVEDKWAASIRTIAGEEVKSLAWENAAPAAFQWDGKNRDGITTPDGVYAYSVTATDRAGNSGSAQLVNIIVDTEATPAQLAIDLSFFSPNGDGAKDAVSFGVKAPATGIEKWSLVVSDKTGPRRTFSGKLSVPETMVWDGKDDAGAVLPEGGYTAKLDILYVNGNNPKAESPVITIDVTPPSAAAKAEYDVFSPNGDGNKDTVTIFQDTSEELFWTGTVKDSADREARATVWRGKADPKWAWDGRGESGAPLPDGGYRYSLATTDRAGNTGASQPLSLRIDTSETPVRVSTDLTYFSPNADGVKDRVRIIPSLRVTAGVDSYTVRVKNAKSELVRAFSGRNKAPDEITWDGMDDAGKRAADGQYAAELEVVYANGNRPLVVSNPFFVDTRIPQIDVKADMLLFSPTPDSRLPAIAVRQSSSEEDLWEGEIQDAKAAKVRGWFWKGKAADFSWDGKDENGNRAPDGYYAYIVRSQTKAGNGAAKELRGIQIDTRPTPVYITASSSGFSPNGDGVRDDVTFTILVTLKEGVKAWRVTMLNAAAGVQKEFTGASPVPATIAWDGKDKGGFQSAPEGSYTAVLQVEYAKGNVAEAKTAPFLLDVSAPKVDISFEGLPFSPDNDGVNDELAIKLKVDSQVPISSWEIVILDPAQHFFNRFSGKGAPSEKIIWNGISETGDLVDSAQDYTLTFAIRDELGNAATFTKSIPVDVLVIKEGDKYKVKIASITFVGDKADFVNVEPEKAEKNAWAIGRLAEIFKKYSQYKIRIEGHANRVNWENKSAWAREDAELLPLSKARADAIRDALVRAGIDAPRLTTAGLGATLPVVDFGDKDNIWKNRRVEFILLR